MKFNKTAIRSISATLVLAQLSLAMQPLMAATRADKGASSPMAQAQLKQMQALQRSMDEGKAAQAAAALSPADRASTNLARVEELVRDLRYLGEEGDEAGAATKPGQEQVRAIGQTTKAKVRSLTAEQQAQRQSRRTALWNELKGLLAQQGQDQGAVRSEFGQTRKMLIERKLPAVILARHDEAVAKFEQRVAQFNQAATKAASGDEAALAQLTAFFDENPTKRRAAPVDPKNLPWRTPEPTKRMPAETQTAWFQNLYGREGTRLAQAGNSLAGLTFITPPDAGSAPTEADLAETPETQRTAAIVAKATELGNNPVAIQNWVRNNVEWVPTWGAIQSAEDTLNKKRGNAIDIASLEIALLRAAKIPARYQFGTIELPAEQVMNWVGGVSKPEAAQQLLGQGGIANRGLIEGGKISKIRMEHAWVQAYVNWVPSRGAKQGSASQHPNPLAQRNAWVPLDPSFKQYENKRLLNTLKAATTAVGSPCVKLTDDFSRAGTTMPGGGVKLDAAKWSSSVKEECYRSLALEASRGGVSPDAVLRKGIVAKTVSLLGASPVSVATLGASSAEIPGALRWSLKIELFDQQTDPYEDSPLLVKTVSLAQAGGGRLAITFSPASQADAESIEAVKAGGGGVLPAYQIAVVPRLMLDNEVLASGNAQRMASQERLKMTLTGPSESYPVYGRLSAGDDVVVALNAGGVPPEKVKARYAFQGSSSSLENLYTVVLNYWMLVDAAEAMAAQLNSVSIVRLPSIGIVASPLSVNYFMGIVRSATYKGRHIDISHKLIGAAGDHGAVIRFMQQAGIQGSNFEAEVFERVFGRQHGGAYSATRLITEAVRQGITVHQIDSANAAAIESLNVPVDIKSEVRNAVQMGKLVVIPEKEPIISNWSGLGYVILDPESGAGAYLINGGLNGGQDPGDCGTEGSPEPQAETVQQENTNFSSNTSLYIAIAAVIVLLLLAPEVVAFAITSALFGVSSANAAPGGGGLPSQLQELWDQNWGKVRPFETGPNYPGDDIRPPGTCGDELYQQLKQDKEEACDTPGRKLGCEKGLCDLPTIQERMGLVGRCITARLEMMTVCFKGGDGEHWNQVEQNLRNLRNCRKCEARVLRGGQCSK